MTRRASLIASYEQRVASGAITRSAAQEQAVVRLTSVVEAVTGHRRGILSMLRRRDHAQPRGLYMWGGVGRGKTMVMDMFFECVPLREKRRAHFHEFMADVHHAIGRARKAHPGDPIPIVAQDIAAAARLLCFDELHVTDIADAMILGRLFRALFAKGVVVVATSNVPPRELYRNGLNRDLFLPFVDLIEAHMDVYAFEESIDYRQLKLSGRQLYFAPADERASQGMDALWREFTGGETTEGEIAVLGRTIEVPRMGGGSARFDFADLCASPLGPRDYLAIARRFHTIFIDAVPVLTPAKRNEARRFINLVDTLYDNRVGLVVSADAEPEQIYAAGDGADHFERTASRLKEMRSAAYIAERDARHRLGADAKSD